jgi:hypothetical protein
MTVAVLVVLGLLRYRPWQHSGAENAPGSRIAAADVANGGTGRQKLTVGFLPVT